MGITIIRIIDKKNWKRPTTETGLVAVAVGLPKVGDEVVEDISRTTMNISELLKLKEKEYIKEILPVS